MNADDDFAGQVGAELGKHPSRLSDDARPVDLGLVPARRNSEQRPGGAVRVFTLLWTWFMETLSRRGYAKRMNPKRKAKDGIARLIEDFDLPLVPTVPQLAQPFPPANVSVAAYCDPAWNRLANSPN